MIDLCEEKKEKEKKPKYDIQQTQHVLIVYFDFDS